MKKFLAMVVIFTMALGVTGFAAVITKNYANDNFVNATTGNLPVGWDVGAVDSNSSVDISKTKALVLSNFSVSDSSIATCEYGIGNGTPLIFELDFSYKSGSSFVIRQLQGSGFSNVLSVEADKLKFQTSSGWTILGNVTPDEVHTLKVSIQSFNKLIDVSLDGNQLLTGGKSIGGYYAPGTLKIINTGSVSEVSIYRYSKRAVKYSGDFNDTFYDGSSPKWSTDLSGNATASIQEKGKINSMFIKNGADGYSKATRKFGPINGRPITVEISFAYKEGSGANFRLMQDESSGWIGSFTIENNELLSQYNDGTISKIADIKPNKVYNLKIQLYTISGSTLNPGRMNVYLDNVPLEENKLFIGGSGCGLGYVHIYSAVAETKLYISKFSVISPWATSVNGFTPINDSFKNSVPTSWNIETSGDTNQISVTTESVEQQGLCLRNRAINAETLTATKTFDTVVSTPQTVTSVFSNAGAGTKVIRFISATGAWLANFTISDGKLSYSKTASTAEVVKDKILPYTDYELKVTFSGGVLNAWLNTEKIINSLAYTSGGPDEGLKNINYYVVNGYSDFNIKSLKVDYEKTASETLEIKNKKIINKATGNVPTEIFTGIAVAGATIVNDTLEDKNLILFAVSYNGSKLINISPITNITIKSGNELNAKSELLIDANKDKNVKMFVFDSLEGMTPLTEFVAIP